MPAISVSNVMLGLDKGSSDRIAEHSSPVGTIWTIRTSRGGRYTRLWHDISEFWEIFCHITAIDHKIPLNTCLLRSSLRSQNLWLMAGNQGFIPNRRETEISTARMEDECSAFNLRSFYQYIEFFFFYILYNF